LFALPVIAVGIACVLTAAGAAPDPREGESGAALLHFAGQLLVGLAFALALARPPAPSPLYSGNTLATALIGLALFAGCLRATRRPVYLYLAFAALFVSYFGAGYFISDLMRALEDTARRALGYEHVLPLAFKSLNALLFNILLAGLALLFDRRWKEP